MGHKEPQASTMDEDDIPPPLLSTDGRNPLAPSLEKAFRLRCPHRAFGEGRGGVGLPDTDFTFLRSAIEWPRSLGILFSQHLLPFCTLPLFLCCSAVCPAGSLWLAIHRRWSLASRITLTSTTPFAQSITQLPKRLIHVLRRNRHWITDVQS